MSGTELSQAISEATVAISHLVTMDAWPNHHLHPGQSRSLPSGHTNCRGHGHEEGHEYRHSGAHGDAPHHAHDYVHTQDHRVGDDTHTHHDHASHDSTPKVIYPCAFQLLLKHASKELNTLSDLGNRLLTIPGGSPSGPPSGISQFRGWLTGSGPSSRVKMKESEVEQLERASYRLIQLHQRLNSTYNKNAPKTRKSKTKAGRSDLASVEARLRFISHAPPLASTPSMMITDTGTDTLPQLDSEHKHNHKTSKLTAQPDLANLAQSWDTT